MTLVLIAVVLAMVAMAALTCRYWSVITELRLRCEYDRFRPTQTRSRYPPPPIPLPTFAPQPTPTTPSPTPLFSSPPPSPFNPFAPSPPSLMEPNRSGYNPLRPEFDSSSIVELEDYHYEPDSGKIPGVYIPPIPASARLTMTIPRPRPPPKLPPKRRRTTSTSWKTESRDSVSVSLFAVSSSSSSLISSIESSSIYTTAESTGVSSSPYDGDSSTDAIKATIDILTAAIQKLPLVSRSKVVDDITDHITR